MTQAKHHAEHGTDEAFYDLMQLSGSAILKLIGFDPIIAESYQFRAIELKQKQVQKPDIEAIPALEGQNKHALIEFQGYRDPLIRCRALRNLALAATSVTNGKPIISIIIYTTNNIKKAAKSLSELMPDITQNPIREYILTDYSEEQLLNIDPRLVLLIPFTVPIHLDKAALKQRNLEWTKQIRSIYTDAQEQEIALNIFGLLLLNRFRTLQEQEVLDMLNIDLMESRAVQQVYERGVQEGIQQGKLQGVQQGKLEGIKEGIKKAEQRDIQEIRNKTIQVLHKRFGEIPAQASEALTQFETLDEVMNAFEMAYSCDSTAAFIAYCQQQ